MSITRRRTYEPDDVEHLCRTSEFRPTYFGKAAAGHTYRLHIAITKAEMAERGDKLVEGWDPKNKKWQSGPPLLAITAFITNDDAFRAGAITLNSPNAQAALSALDAAQTGTRAEISNFQNVPIRVRYLTGDNQVKTMPGQWFMMVVDRNEIEPYGLQLQTHFPLISDKAAVRAVIKSRTGAVLKTIP
jgi:hypothetical protein